MTTQRLDWPILIQRSQRKLKRYSKSWEEFVAQLTERLLPIPENPGSNPAIVIFFNKHLKLNVEKIRKRGRECHVKGSYRQSKGLQNSGPSWSH